MTHHTAYAHPATLAASAEASKSTVHVEAFSRVLEQARLSNGTYVPIVTWIDELGDECEAGEGVIFVCGSDLTGWWNEECSDYTAAAN